MTEFKYKLEDFISLGYDLIKNLEEKYSNTRADLRREELPNFYRLRQGYIDHVKSRLPNISRQKSLK